MLYHQKLESMGYPSCEDGIIRC